MFYLQFGHWCRLMENDFGNAGYTMHVVGVIGLYYRMRGFVGFVDDVIKYEEAL